MEKNEVKFESYDPSVGTRNEPSNSPAQTEHTTDVGEKKDFGKEESIKEMSVDLASAQSASHLAQLLSSSPAPTTSNGSSTSNMNMDPDVLNPANSHGTVHKHSINNNSDSGPFLCANCGQKITERFLLKTMGKHWHEDCLKCACCSCRLGEVGSKLYFKQDMMLCKRDYLRLFGLTGLCAACHKSIPAFEMVMRARSNVYHLECFGCQECSHRFCVGDKFYLCDNKILCEYDYHERAYFAQMAAYNYNNIAQLKQQFPEDLDVEVQPVQSR